MLGALASMFESEVAKKWSLVSKIDRKVFPP